MASRRQLRDHAPARSARRSRKDASGHCDRWFRARRTQRDRCDRMLSLLRLTGVAHVVVIDRAAAEAMTKRFGRSRSLQDGAVRLATARIRRAIGPVQLRRCGQQVDDTDVRAQPRRRTSSSRPVLSPCRTAEIAIARALVPVGAPAASSRTACSPRVGRRCSWPHRPRKKRERQRAVRRELEAALAKRGRRRSRSLQQAVTQLRLERETLTRERDDARDEARRLGYRLSTAWRESDEGAADEGKLPALDRHPGQPGTRWKAWIDDVRQQPASSCCRRLRKRRANRRSRTSRSPTEVFEFLSITTYRSAPAAPTTSKPASSTNRPKRRSASKSLRSARRSKTGATGCNTSAATAAARSSSTSTPSGRAAARPRAGSSACISWYDADKAQVVVGHLPTHLVNRITLLRGKHKQLLFFLPPGEGGTECRMREYPPARKR